MGIKHIKLQYMVIGMRILNIARLKGRVHMKQFISDLTITFYIWVEGILAIVTGFFS